MNEMLKRKPNRLKNYVYNRNGAYFITICAKNRENVFGHIVGCGKNVFQRSFHDHIIRDEADYKRIWSYIDTNPIK